MKKDEALLKEVKNDLAENKKNHKAIKKIIRLKQRMKGGQKYV